MFACSKRRLCFSNCTCLRRRCGGNACGLAHHSGSGTRCYIEFAGARGKMMTRSKRRAQGAGIDAAPKWHFKCRFCGLVAHAAQALFSHLKSCHPHTSWTYQQRPECYEPWKVLRKKRCDSETKSVSNMSVGQDSFAGLALRQPGVIVPSLETSCCFLRFRSTFVLRGCRRHSCSAPRAAWHLCC